MILVTGSDSSLGRELMAGPLSKKVRGLPMDVMMYKSRIEELIDHLMMHEGPITHVINNHGINHLSWIGMTEEEDQQILVENVMAPYWTINALVAAGQTCRVVNVASATYRVPQRCTALYCASKAAVVQMTKVMARELAPKGWIINAIAPGLIVDTEMAELTGQQVLELRGWDHEEAGVYATKLVTMCRFTTKKEVAAAIWKILELPDYINGTVIDMMGGV